MSVPICNRQLAYCVRNERHVLVIRYKYNGQKHEAAVVLRINPNELRRKYTKYNNIIKIIVEFSLINLLVQGVSS